MSENDIMTEIYGDPFSISGTKRTYVMFTLLSWGKKISSTKHVELTLEGCRCFFNLAPPTVYLFHTVKQLMGK